MTRAPLLFESATLRLVHLSFLAPFLIATGTMTAKVFPLLTLRAHDIHQSTLPDFSKPGEVSSASRYFARDHTVEKLK